MDVSQLLEEVQYKAVRSSGAGGQHVNKVATKVVLTFSIATSKAFSEIEKERLLQKLDKRISSEGFLTVTSSDSRSQYRNKMLATDKLIALLQQALKVNKPRKKSKPSKAAIEKRIKAKKNQALKKHHRKRPPLDL